MKNKHKTEAVVTSPVEVTLTQSFSGELSQSKAEEAVAAALAAFRDVIGTEVDLIGDGDGVIIHG